MYQDYIPCSNFTFNDINVTLFKDGYIYNDFEKFYQDSENRAIFDALYYELKNFYATYVQDTLPNYRISVIIKSTSSSNFKLELVALNLYVYSASNAVITLRNSYYLGTYYTPLAIYDRTNSDAVNMMFNLTGTGFYIINDTVWSDGNFYDRKYYNPFNSVPFKSNSNGSFYLPTLSFESSFDKKITGTTDVWKIYDSDSNLIGEYDAGDSYPTVIQPNELESNYTTVSLDSYEYVILNLKDYNQTDAFNTTLQVKGMVGITPVYEFGTLEKTQITNRCNISTSDYTNYSLYVLDSDLLNNSVYYVKSCKSGSSFKFDNTLFDVTYVTTETVDDPVITVGGVEYHTIPFDKLSNSANKNEESNFVPGQVGSSLTDIIDNASKFTSDIWNAITSFMGLVTKFFNTLPEEFRAISILGFTVLVTISVIKFLRG